MHQKDISMITGIETQHCYIGTQFFADEIYNKKSAVSITALSIDIYRCLVLFFVQGRLLQQVLQSRFVGVNHCPEGSAVLAENFLSLVCINFHQYSCFKVFLRTAGTVHTAG